jgi:6-pyruvoyltetrahydropterin/6-carboxytetrahydropterin synthase
MAWKVRVEGTDLRFSAAHFTTFEGQCEPLHGHNYAVTVEVGGELTEDSWVVDFVRLRKMARRICDELDHRFLLQLDSPVLEVSNGTRNWKVRFGERGWVFPEAEVAALPIDNSTAERLAEWFAGRLGEELRAAGAANVTAITAGIEEAPGQSAWYSRSV